MLARIVTRPAATLWRGFQLQRRFIRSSRYQLQAPPRPNTWLAKIRFQADGKPRSKPIAFGFGSIVLFDLLLLYAIFDQIEDVGITAELLERIIYVQRMDFTYDSVNFDDPVSNLSYFKKLYRCFFVRASDEMVDNLFRDLMEIYRTTTKDGGGGGSTTITATTITTAEAEALRIMRSTAEKIHGALRDLNQDSFKFVLLVMTEAMQSLLDLMLQVVVSVEGDDGESSRFHLKLKRDKSDGGLKDYEILG